MLRHPPESCVQRGNWRNKSCTVDLLDLSKTLRNQVWGFSCLHFFFLLKLETSIYKARSDQRDEERFFHSNRVCVHLLRLRVRHGCVPARHLAIYLFCFGRTAQHVPTSSTVHYRKSDAKGKENIWETVKIKGIFYLERSKGCWRDAEVNRSQVLCGSSRSHFGQYTKTRHQSTEAHNWLWTVTTFYKGNIKKLFQKQWEWMVSP